MVEKRRYKRLPIKLLLEVSEVFKQDNDVITDLNAEVEVYDISKAGIGFTTSTVLPEGYYIVMVVNLLVWQVFFTLCLMNMQSTWRRIINYH